MGQKLERGCGANGFKGTTGHKESIPPGPCGKSRQEGGACSEGHDAQKCSAQIICPFLALVVLWGTVDRLLVVGDGIVVVATRGSGSGGADRRLAAAECILKLPYLKQPLYFKSVYLMARSIRSKQSQTVKSLVSNVKKSRGEDHSCF